MDGWMDGWLDGWMEWMDGRTDGQKDLYYTILQWPIQFKFQLIN